MSAAEHRQQPEPSSFGDPASGIHRVAPRVPELPERYVRPRLFVACSAVTLVVSLAVGAVAAAAGQFEFAAAMVGPAAAAALTLSLADSLGLAS